MKNILKILWKIVLSIIILIIVLITIIRLFFPIYKVEPLHDNQDWIIIEASYVLTQKYFYENNLKETDFVIYKNILDRNYVVLPYNKNTFLKYKNNIIWKVIYKLN